ncbi:hypothetical protein [Treponema primitia]|uniref:hypothetical protein n=1 Tax=Treponema primitia TaxID=88058 RepID=UPI0012FDB9FB|nr:hypothetical protein [Treponema primitia]
MPRPPPTGADTGAPTGADTGTAQPASSRAKPNAQMWSFGAAETPSKFLRNLPEPFSSDLLFIIPILLMCVSSYILL